ncbi:hypothetical protein IWZ03DRAFT_386053 [Phyllosticta citriasiana]|uniref:Uncharacterized protein n=1 Tax=Phyllosticta citriasiana TaxID=595635 RepID=A0ABR1KCY8_9PEZI
MAATHKFSEHSIKLALLIASTFDLNGLLNDARLMEGELVRRGFEIIRRYGEDATQEGILAAWNSLILRLENRTEPTVINGKTPVVACGWMDGWMDE